MSRAGMRAAEEHGRKLPAFPSLEAATAALFKRRDENLAYLQSIYPVELDFSGESLKTVEAWYFSHFANGEKRSGDLLRDAVEVAIGTYFGEVLVRANPRNAWAVKPYVFTPGTYELAVCRPLFQFSIGRRKDLYATPSNVRRQSLYRQFKQYAG